LKRWIKLFASLAITGVCFWWTFRHMSDPSVTCAAGTDCDRTRWYDMFQSLKDANYLWLLPYLGVLTLIHLFRTWRWGNLLSGLEKVKFSALNEASGVGFMMLIVLPFRLGEFARPFLIAERSTIRRSAAMTSVVLERIVDGIVMAVLLRVLVFFLPTDAPDIAYVRAGANLMFLVFFSGLVFLLIARWQHDRTLAVLRAVFGKVSPKLAERVVYVVDGFVGALKQLPDAKNLAGFFFFTAAYWAVNGLGMTLLANAFDCHGAAAGCLPLHLTPYQGYVILSVLIIGMMIPAAPGSAGTFQAFIVLGLGLFLPRDTVSSSGVAFANVLWVTQILQQILFGVVLMLWSNRSFRGIAGKLGEKDDSRDRPTRDEHDGRRPNPVEEEPAR
jgi:uncharacterized protein (TIRG00374 family)